MVQVKGSMLQANESNVTERENVGEFDLTAWLDSQPERHAPAWEDPDAHHFDLANYLKCQPVFDLSAWLRDTSESLKPGCPTIRLTDCASVLPFGGMCGGTHAEKDHPLGGPGLDLDQPAIVPWLRSGKGCW